MVEELSGQVEIETIKTASVPAKQAKSGDTDGDSETKGSPVRVVGMDEGTVSTARGQWGSRMMSIGGGPPKADMLENELGKLVIDEGKSRYVSNSFWARSVSKSIDMTLTILTKSRFSGEVHTFLKWYGCNMDLLTLSRLKIFEKCSRSLSLHLTKMKKPLQASQFPPWTVPIITPLLWDIALQKWTCDLYILFHLKYLSIGRLIKRMSTHCVRYG